MNIKRTPAPPPESSRTRKLLGAAAALALVVTLLWWPGCRQYPPVSSRENLDLIKLVYTACNTKNPQRLAMVEAKIDNAARSGEMSPQEEAGFRKIVALARGGDWQAAEAAALRFAQDQIGQGK